MGKRQPELRKELNGNHTKKIEVTFPENDDKDDEKLKQEGIGDEEGTVDEEETDDEEESKNEKVERNDQTEENNDNNDRSMNTNFL